MKVKELIKKLRKYNKNAVVIVAEKSYMSCWRNEYDIQDIHDYEDKVWIKI